MREAVTNQQELRSVGYPRVENGKKVLLPEYSALTDPHLVDYYARKFSLATVPRPPTGVSHCVCVFDVLKWFVKMAGM